MLSHALKFTIPRSMFLLNPPTVGSHTGQFQKALCGSPVRSHSLIVEVHKGNEPLVSPFYTCFFVVSATLSRPINGPLFVLRFQCLLTKLTAATAPGNNCHSWMFQLWMRFSNLLYFENVVQQVYICKLLRFKKRVAILGQKERDILRKLEKFQARWNDPRTEATAGIAILDQSNLASGYCKYGLD